MIGIGDFDSKARKTREVCTRIGQRMYRGKKYAEEKETGYLVCTSGKRKRLHVAMYEAERLGGAEVPPGMIIHHRDWNKRNNVIDNLVMVTVQEHNLIHNPPPIDKMTEEEKRIYEDLKNRGLIIDKISKK